MDKIPVMVRRIDPLRGGREIPRPKEVKIDVEGAEIDVLSGSLETWRVSRPTIFLEAHGAALETACSEQLLRLGYKIRCLEGQIPGGEAARHLVCLP